MGETLTTDAAFETLYRHHERALLAFCRWVLRSDEDARDAVQNTRSNPRAWPFRIAHNECVNVMRAARAPRA